MNKVFNAHKELILQKQNYETIKHNYYKQLFYSSWYGKTVGKTTIDNLHIIVCNGIIAIGFEEIDNIDELYNKICHIENPYDLSKLGKFADVLFGIPQHKDDDDDDYHHVFNIIHKSECNGVYCVKKELELSEDEINRLIKIGNKLIYASLKISAKESQYIK